nr:hypothetical protein BaRGS_001934 [Batillaria attramentaria]
MPPVILHSKQTSISSEILLVRRCKLLTLLTGVSRRDVVLILLAKNPHTQRAKADAKVKTIPLVEGSPQGLQGHRTLLRVIAGDILHPSVNQVLANKDNRCMHLLRQMGSKMVKHKQLQWRPDAFLQRDPILLNDNLHVGLPVDHHVWNIGVTIKNAKNKVKTAWRRLRDHSDVLERTIDCLEVLTEKGQIPRIPATLVGVLTQVDLETLQYKYHAMQYFADHLECMMNETDANVFPESTWIFSRPAISNEEHHFWNAFFPGLVGSDASALIRHFNVNRSMLESLEF